MLKWLVGLSAAQTMLLIFVALRVVAVDMRTDDIASNSERAADAAAHRPAAMAAQPSTLGLARGAGAVNIDDIRAVIREEIALLAPADKAARNSDSELASASQNPTRQPPTHQSNEQTKRAAAAFAQELNIYRNRGDLTEMQISDLYGKIAKLPPGAQNEALSQLAKAVNSGAISARM